MNYTNYPFRLEKLKEVCNDCMNEIAIDYELFVKTHRDKGITDIKIRYVLEEGVFGYAYMGNFFFIEDCMYVISDDEVFADIHNDHMPMIASETFNCEWQRQEKYITRVIFAGIETPFKDNMGDHIYTGDIVLAKQHIISGVCAFPPFYDDKPLSAPAMYALMLDNCMLLLNECNNLRRFGTIFFALHKQETEIDIEGVISGRAQHGGFDRDFLTCARYTPSFEQELWKYHAMKELGVEYNWRRDK